MRKRRDTETHIDAHASLRRHDRPPGSIHSRILGLIAVAVLCASCSSGGQSNEDVSVGQAGAASQSDASVTSTKKTETVLARRYEVGDCVISEEAENVLGGSDHLSTDGKTATRVVPCDRPHLYEITGTFRLRGYPEYPTPEQWNEIFRKAGDGCRPFAERFLNSPLDPSGKFISTGIKPSPAYWATGNRDVWCALGPARDPLDRSNGRALSEGSARGQSQTRLRPVGTCLAIIPGAQQTTTPVSCDKPHSFEVTGSVSIADRAPARPSTDEQWERLVEADCRRLAETYLARPIDNQTLRVSNYSISAESWLAGRREVECAVGRYDVGGVKIPVAGLLRDQP